ncbi:histidine phosphatase family protein [Paramagnetospirillum kuznetsovii]|uniref:Histidine phosphatase family protein n=1 Tax=Paramagnetospirillum kuznetsovii TaxID=2053833 RepID=A0A364NVF6_9PROT|nr:histidine phosphatase family protein [Paramagnetospirillum kuznetsovii]RAU20887.1 histidine phosphatase family protein [Paramagnetospirillum kuznetsovii]
MAIILFVATAVLGPVRVHADATGAAPAEAAKFKEITATKETLEQLRRGGWALYMRHGRTDNTKPDRYPSVDLNDCSTQRPLTEDGLKMATQVGEEVRKARIPIGEIRISPLCRVKDTVAAAFPNQAFTLDNELLYTANLTDAEKQPIIANTRRLLSAPVANGVNRLLIAHAPNLMDLIGYFPKEGTLVVFRPKGNGEFDYIGSIPPSLWPNLQQ